MLRTLAPQVNASWLLHKDASPEDLLKNVLPIRRGDKPQSYMTSILLHHNRLRSLGKFVLAELAKKDAIIKDLENRNYLMLTMDEHTEFMTSVELRYKERIQYLQGIISSFKGVEEQHEPMDFMPTPVFNLSSPGRSSASPSPLRHVFNEEEPWTNPSKWTQADIESLVWGVERYNTTWWCLRQNLKPELSLVQQYSIPDMKSMWAALLAALPPNSLAAVAEGGDRPVEGEASPRVTHVPITEDSLGGELYGRLLRLRDSLYVELPPPLRLTPSPRRTPTPEKSPSVEKTTDTD